MRGRWIASAAREVVMSFSMIAAVGRNRELGKEGKLLFRLPGDLQFFKETTMGHKILMGRRTWESLPGKLPGREHYVVTRHPEDLEGGGRSENAGVGGSRSGCGGDVGVGRLGSGGGDVGAVGSGVVAVTDLQEFIREWKERPEEIFVIGGGMVYWEMMKDADKLYLTEVEAEAEADTFFPEFDKSEFSRKVLKQGEENGLKYAICEYTRKV